jgi:hypothetical protein
MRGCFTGGDIWFGGSIEYLLSRIVLSLRRRLIFQVLLDSFVGPCSALS